MKLSAHRKTRRAWTLVSLRDRSTVYLDSRDAGENSRMSAYCVPGCAINAKTLSFVASA